MWVKKKTNGRDSEYTLRNNLIHPMLTDFKKIFFSLVVNL